MARPKVAIVHPRLGFSGSETRVLWTAEALKGWCDVTLITGGPVDLRRMNAFYGTGIQEGEISILRTPMPPGLKDSPRFTGLRWAFTLRFCRKLAPGFDLMVNGYGTADFGRRGFQYIADFGFDQEVNRRLNPLHYSQRSWWYGRSPLRKAYKYICEAVSSTAGDKWKRNVTLANSHWTADLMRMRYGVEPDVLYAPVPADYPDVGPEDREPGFVCLSRISPEKRIHKIIEILDRVRQRGHDIHLHVAGGLNSSEYSKSLKDLAARHHEWVFLEGRVFQRAKVDLISRHRFAIHACRNEAFGIAVAEMVKGGCLTFVSNKAGPAEIVNHPALMFESEDDAVQKIDSVLSNKVGEEALRSHLRQRAKAFSREAFRKRVRALVGGFLQEEDPDRRRRCNFGSVLSELGEGVATR